MSDPATPSPLSAATSAPPGTLRVLGRVVATPALRRLLGAYAAFTAAEYGSWIALLVYAYAHGGATASGVVSIVLLAPCAALGPFVGWLGDRFGGARVLRVGYLAQAVSTAVLGVAILLDAPTFLVYALGFGYAPCYSVTRPSQAALLPSLVRTPAELTAGNAVAGWAESTGVILGPLIAGLAVGPLGAGGVTVLFASLALVSFLAVLPLARGADSADTSGSADEAEAISSTLAALRHPGIATLLTVLTAAWVAAGAVEILTVVLSYRVLGTGASGVGYLDAAAGAGGFVSIILTLAFVGRARLAPAMIMASVGFALAFVVLAFQHSLVMAFLLLALAGALRYAFGVAGQTLLQRLAPPDVLARVFGLLEGIGMVGFALGSLIVPVATSLTGPRGAIIAVALCLPAIVLVLLPSLLRVDAHATVPVVEIGLLRQTAIFAPLPGPELEAIARLLEPLELRDGAMIVQEGDAGDHLFAIAGGLVRVSKGGVTLATLGRGAVVGEMALLDDAPRNATATAVGDVHLYALQRAPFLTALTHHVRVDAAARRLAAGRADEIRRIAT